MRCDVMLPFWWCHAKPHMLLAVLSHACLRGLCLLLRALRRPLPSSQSGSHKPMADSPLVGLWEPLVGLWDQRRIRPTFAMRRWQRAVSKIGPDTRTRHMRRTTGRTSRNAWTTSERGASAPTRKRTRPRMRSGPRTARCRRSGGCGWSCARCFCPRMSCGGGRSREPGWCDCVGAWI